MAGKRLIVMHPSPLGYFDFDIYGSEDDIPPSLDKYMYRVEDCPIVKRLGLEGYVGSTDLAYPPEANEEIMQGIITLLRKGYNLVWMDIEGDDLW